MNHGDFIGALIMAGASLTLTVLLARLMWRGWRARGQRQIDTVGELPVVPAERGDIDWYVVCFTCGLAGERSVTCGCGNPSSTSISR